MKYYVQSAHIRDRADGLIHWVVKCPDGTYFDTHLHLWKLKKRCFHDFVLKVR